MINASYDKEFIFHDGSRAKNLLELFLKLEHISDNEFHEFVNKEKNDFASWIDFVLHDSTFAKKLRMTDDREETINFIRSRMHDLATELVLSHSESTPHTLNEKIISETPNPLISIKASPNISSNVKKDTSGSIYDAANRTEMDNIKASRNWFRFLLKKNTGNENAGNINSGSIGHNKTELIGAPSIKPAITYMDKPMDKHKPAEESIFKPVSESPKSVNVNPIGDNSEIKASRNWFKFSLHQGAFRKKNHFGNDSLQTHHASNSKEHDKHVEEDDDEHAFWTMVYVVLILLILALLFYKFVL